MENGVCPSVSGVFPGVPVDVAEALLSAVHGAGLGKACSVGDAVMGGRPACPHQSVSITNIAGMVSRLHAG